MVQRKTNKGQVIDMDALIAAQGDRPAVGNAGTDALAASGASSVGHACTRAGSRRRGHARGSSQSSGAVWHLNSGFFTSLLRCHTDTPVEANRFTIQIRVLYDLLAQGRKLRR